MAQVAERKDLKQWVRNIEEHIITISGPALATSGIIAGLDVVTNNFIARNMPTIGAAMGLIWAISLMLTLDFQVLTLGVRARRVYTSKKSGGQKAGEMVLAVLIALALGYVSLQMGSIFARMMGTSITMEQAQAELGINPIALIYERSAMVMLLIFMSGWLRDEGEQKNTPPAAPAPSITDETMQLILGKLAKLDALEQALTAQVVISEQQGEQQLLPAPEGEHEANTTPEEDGAISPEQAIGNFERVQAYLGEHPEAKVRDVALALSISNSTANKWMLKARSGEQQAND